MSNIVYHTFDVFYNSDSEILILGSMPSITSREKGFYYMHPQNRFWIVLGLVFNEEIGSTIEEKKKFLIKHKIALWDVLESCEINGSSDASIKNVIPNDIKSIIEVNRLDTFLVKMFVNSVIVLIFELIIPIIFSLELDFKLSLLIFSIFKKILL